MKNNPIIKTNPIMEIIAKKMLGYDGVSKYQQSKMVRAAAKAAMNYHKKEVEKLEERISDTEDALTEAINCINSMKCCGNCGTESKGGECDIESILENGIDKFICKNWTRRI